jgi:hypothetical protein
MVDFAGVCLFDRQWVNGRADGAGDPIKSRSRGMTRRRTRIREWRMSQSANRYPLRLNMR